MGEGENKMNIKELMNKGVSLYFESHGECDTGYIIVAEVRLQQGNWYRVRESLVQYGADDFLLSLYKYRCAKRALEIIEKGESYSGWWADFMEGKEIEEILSPLSKEDYKLLVKRQKKEVEAIEEYLRKVKNDYLALYDLEKERLEKALLLLSKYIYKGEGFSEFY